MPDFTIEGLTEEQVAAVQSEIDRRANQAAETASAKATEKVTKELSEKLAAQYEQKYQQDLLSATEKIKTEVTMTEEEKVNQALNDLKTEQERFKREQLKFRAEQTLRDSGFTDTAIENLAPIFGAFDSQEALDTALTNLVTVNQESVTEAIKADREKLAAQATPPGQSGATPNPKDTSAQIASIREGVENPQLAAAMEAQLLLEMAATEG